MINLKCKICDVLFDNARLMGIHVAVFHKIKKEDYYLKYINSTVGKCKYCNKETRFISITRGYSRCCGHKCAKLLDSKSPEYREKISIATKIAMQREDVKRNHLTAVNKPKSEDTIKKISDAAKQRYMNDPTLRNKIYTDDRNDKISKLKKIYWKTHQNEKKRVGNIWKILKNRDETGWRNHLLRASQLGFKKIFSNDGETTLEIKMYDFLSKNNIKYKKQYELEYKLYDAYLIDYNILLEFDGDFWHKQSLDECIYPFQKNSFYNDIRKNEIAKKHNIPLFRIRENESPEKILEYLESVNAA